MQFVREAWHVVEPGTPFIEGWHLSAIAVHLEAITAGAVLPDGKLFNRFLDNVPPGTMKSLLTNVFWPAWEWGPKDRPTLQYLCAAHELDLAVRDNLRMRRLVESEWYQARWPLKFRGDQNEKEKFENVKGGIRFARSITSLTGARGDRVLFDDPHSVKTAESDTQREDSVMNFREAGNNRLNDPQRSVIVVTMQRLHEGDISGYIIESLPEYVKLILPMEFEEKQRCVTPFFADPRKDEGELLFPERFPRWVIERDRNVYTDYAWAGQMQQRPAPREAGFFMVDRIQQIETAPVCSMWVRGWDLAGSKRSTSAYTSGVLLGKFADGYVIADVVRDKRTPGEVRKLIRTTAENDGKGVRIRFPQDPGQAGVAQVEDYAKLLDGFTFKAVLPTGEKATRAEPFSAQVEHRRVFMVKAKWNDAFKEELRMFPSGRFKDQVDAASDAYAELNSAKPLPTASASR